MNFHRNVVVANDSFLHFFKQFRDHIYARSSVSEWTPGGPFSDNFYNPNVEARRGIASSSFSEVLTEEDKSVLNSRVDETTSKFHPDLLNEISCIDAASFRDFFTELLELVREHYPKEGCDNPMLGFKMSWLEDFIPPMLRAFPEFKVLLLYRDVRAIAASQNAKAEKRPYLFYARHWRKSIASLLAFTDSSYEFSDRVLPVCYEKLVSAPEAEARRICGFLNLEFDPAMTDVSSQVDQTTGSNWTPNSSYGEQEGIFTSSVERWKQLLTNEQIAFLEYLCAPELTYLGYDLVTDGDGEFRGPTMEPPEDELVPWLQGAPESAHISDMSIWNLQMEREALRRRVLSGDEDVSNNLMLQLFIYPECFAAISEAYRRLNG